MLTHRRVTPFRILRTLRKKDAEPNKSHKQINYKMFLQFQFFKEERNLFSHRAQEQLGSTSWQQQQSKSSFCKQNNRNKRISMNIIKEILVMNTHNNSIYTFYIIGTH